MLSSRQVVEAWHAALNMGDVDGAHALVVADVVLGGPRGHVQGAAVHRQWVSEAGIQLLPVAWHQLDAHTLVVEQDATWPGRADWEAGAAPLRVASRFQLTPDATQISAILRFDSVDEALAAGS